jgi:hypothetical protein
MAASDDVAAQIEERFGVLSETPTFILYDPRILSDLLYLRAFESQVQLFRSRLVTIKEPIEYLKSLIPPSGTLSTPPDAKKVSTEINGIRALARRLGLHKPPVTTEYHSTHPGSRPTHAGTSRIGAQSKLLKITPIEQAGEFSGTGTTTAASGNYVPVFTGTSPGVMGLQWNVGVGPSGSGGVGGAGGSGGGPVQAPPSPSANPGGVTPLQPSATLPPAPTSIPEFFPNNLQSWVSLFTSAPTLIDSFFGAGSMSSGVAGPTSAESFVVDRIAKRLPGTYYYPSFVPLKAPDAHSPLVKLFEEQLEAHTDVADAQGYFKRFLTVFAQSLQAQISRDAYWPVPSNVETLYNDSIKFLNNPTAENLQKIEADIPAAKLAILTDAELPTNLQAPVQSALDAYAKAIAGLAPDGPYTKYYVAHNELGVLKALRTAQQSFHYSAPAPVNQLFSDIKTIVSPYTGTLPSGEVTIVLGDLIAAEAAVRADPLNSQLGDVVTMLDQAEAELTSTTQGHHGVNLVTFMDPLLALMQSIDATVVSLNSAAGNASAASAAPSGAGAATTPAPSVTVPPVPTAGVAADTFGTVILRGFDYQYVLDHGGKILRVVVEMSYATDRMDSFGLNLPSRKSSAMAQLSFSLFDREGQIDMSGSSLAYLAPAGPKEALSGGRAEIVRDEKEGVVRQARPLIAIRPGAAINNSVECAVFFKQGTPKIEEPKDIVYRWVALDLDEHNPGKRQQTGFVPGNVESAEVAEGTYKFNITIENLVHDHHYRVIVEAVSRKDFDLDNKMESNVAHVIATGSCSIDD